MPRFSAIALGTALAAVFQSACQQRQPPPGAAPGLATPSSSGNTGAALSASPSAGAPSAGALEATQPTPERREPPAPCGAIREPCTPTVAIVARGVLERSRAYLRECRDCAHRADTERVLRRMDAAVPTLTGEEALTASDAALAAGEVDDAAQIVADASPVAGPAFAARARRHLDRAGSLLDGECRVPRGVGIVVSPRSPVAGERVRVLVAREEPGELTMTLEREGFEHAASKVRASGGPPFFQLAEVIAPEAGDYRVVVRVEGTSVACSRARVEASPPVLVAEASLWTSERAWDRGAENLYSAWISLLFRGKEGRRFHGLSELTSDRSRNVLHDHLRHGEDAAPPEGLELEPDCADNPYFLRSYFAWKLRLPFGWHDCRFGGRYGPPKCGSWSINDKAPAILPAPGDRAAAARDPVKEIGRFLRRLKDRAHARSLRTAWTDDESDLYPVELSREHLRPGVVFSDPYGHTFTLVRFVRQTGDEPGKLLAVDAQPDGTLRIKRFWRGNFLFPNGQLARGHGFKAWRPIVRDRGKLRTLSNAEIDVADGYGGYSDEQGTLGSAGFYSAMARLISPRAVPPAEEYRALFEALHEQVLLRVHEVEAGWSFRRGHDVIDMPEGRQVFRTVGPWEDYSTPCRDMRLLVGIDALLAFPDENPSSRAELAPIYERLTRDLVIAYARSDGSSQQLSLADVILRRQEFEVAYNPNDCPEVRWGAEDGSREQRGCEVRASEEQRERMRELRHWFQKRYACG